MNSIDVIKSNVQMADMICGSYLGDLSDADLMKRPHPKCNHINWQIGHLVVSDHSLFSQGLGEGMPDLPEGLAEKYSRETVGNDDPTAFVTKEELLAVHKTQRDALMAKLDTLNEADLDKPTPEAMQSFAPTVGVVLSMMASHWLMHAGQWVIIRRECGKDFVM